MSITRLHKLVVHRHHRLSVLESLEHLDWHLRNLWDGGFKMVSDVDIQAHIDFHAKRKKQLSRKASGQLGLFNYL